MNRDAVYVAILTVLCILLGVLIGAGITSKANLPWPCHERPGFMERAEHFMGPGPMRHHQEKMGKCKEAGKDVHMNGPADEGGPAEEVPPQDK